MKNELFEMGLIGFRAFSGIKTRGIDVRLDLKTYDDIEISNNNSSTFSDFFLLVL